MFSLQHILNEISFRTCNTQTLVLLQLFAAATNKQFLFSDNIFSVSLQAGKGDKNLFCNACIKCPHVEF